MMKTIVFFASVTAMVLLFIQFSKYQLYTHFITLEVFTGLLALVFTILGIWFGLKFTKPKGEIKTITLIAEEIVEKPLIEFGLTKRETEILKQIDLGKSNQEIADELFISISTVKSHVSKLYAKLDVKNRIQAIQKAKKIANTP